MGLPQLKNSFLFLLGANDHFYYYYGCLKGLFINYVRKPRRREGEDESEQKCMGREGNGAICLCVHVTEAVGKHSIHAPGGALIGRPHYRNKVDSEDDEETNLDVRVQDPANDGIPIIMDIIEFLDCP